MKENKMDGAYDTYGIQIHTGCMVERPEGQRLLGRPKGRWRDNNKVDFK
jgi:hypothetical protein